MECCFLLSAAPLFVRIFFGYACRSDGGGEIERDLPSSKKGNASRRWEGEVRRMDNDVEARHCLSACFLRQFSECSQKRSFGVVDRQPLFALAVCSFVSTCEIVCFLNKCTFDILKSIYSVRLFLIDVCVQVLLSTMKPQRTEPKIESHVEDPSSNERRWRSTNHVYSFSVGVSFFVYLWINTLAIMRSMGIRSYVLCLCLIAASIRRKFKFFFSNDLLRCVSFSEWICMGRFWLLPCRLCLRYKNLILTHETSDRNENSFYGLESRIYQVFAPWSYMCF